MTEPKNFLSLNSFTEDTFDEARSSWRERGEGGNGGRDLEFSLSHARDKMINTLFSHNHLFCSRSASASRDWDECTDDVELSSRNDEGDCWIARAGVISLRMNVNLKKKEILKYNFWLLILDSQWNTKAHC